MRCTVADAVTAPAVTGCACATATGWTRAGKPDPAAWAAAAPAVDPAAGRAGVPAAVLHAVDRERPATCSARPHRPGGGSWAAPSIEDFIAHCLLRGRARIDFRGLAPQLHWSSSTPCSAATTQPDDHRAAAGGDLGHPLGPSTLASARCSTATEHAVAGPGSRAQALDVSEAFLIVRPRQWSRRCATAPVGRSSIHRDVWRLHTLPGLIRQRRQGAATRATTSTSTASPSPWLRAAGQTLGPAAADLRADVGTVHRRRRGPDPVQRVPRPRRTRGRRPGRRRPAAAGALSGLARQPARRAEREGGRRHRRLHTFFQADPAARLGRHACRPPRRSSPATPHPGRRS